jgi:hypothetical protein
MRRYDIGEKKNVKKGEVLTPILQQDKKGSER